MAEIFISYKRERRAAAEHLAAIFQRHGYSVWFDYSLIKGADFDFQLDSELRAAKAVVVLWCSKSVESRWVSREAALSASLNTLIPVMIEDCKLKLAHFTEDYVDLRDWDAVPRSHKLDPLFREVTRLVGRAPQQDWAALTAYEENWRRFGALTLAKFALGEPEEEEPKSGTRLPASAYSTQEEFSAAVREWQEHDLDTCDDPGLLKAYAAKWENIDPFWSYKARQKAAGLEAAEERRQGQRRAGGAERDPGEGRIPITAPVITNPSGKWFRPGNGKTEWFKDIDHGPAMIVVPPGNFAMGSPASEERWSAYDKREEPQHKVAIAHPFAVSRFCVTRGEFAAFMKEKKHTMPDGASSYVYTYEDGEWRDRMGRSWSDPGFTQNDSHPVVCVNWDDATAYASWLVEITGHPYRLLSEAEWEYCCRAGTTTPFWCGLSISTAQANYDGNYIYGEGQKGEYRQRTMIVDSFEPNPWGLYQVHGNVWEWCEDNWHEDFVANPPTDGSVWQGGNKSLRVLRGGSWCSGPRYLRAADRMGWGPVVRSVNVGFRLARTL